MHQISTYMFSTVSIAPSFMESLTEVSHTPVPQTVFPHILEPLISDSLPIIKTLKIIEKQIHNLPSRETIPDCRAEHTNQ